MYHGNRAKITVLEGFGRAPGLEPGTFSSQSLRWAFVEHAGNVGSMRKSMSRLRLLTVRRFEPLRSVRHGCGTFRLVNAPRKAPTRAA